MPRFFEDKKRETIDWSTIKEYREEGTVSGICMALAEVHKLLDVMLSDQGYQGDDILPKIKAARERFTDLKALLDGLEVWQKVFKEYDKKVVLREAEEAISAYEKAIYDLSSETDFAPPTLLDRLKSWLDIQLIARPVQRRRAIAYFLAIVILVLTLDNTHFGQRFINWLAGLVNGIVIWAVGIIVGLVIIGLIFSSLISFMEERK